MRQGGWWKIGAGVALGLVVLAVILDTLWSSGEVRADLRVTVTADAQPLGPDRFLYTQALRVRAAPAPPGLTACLTGVDREGRWLGRPRPMTRSGEAFEDQVTASALSGDAFGPVWVVVLASDQGCDQLGGLASATRGEARPMEALSAQAQGAQLGVARIFIHDKLTQ